MTPPSTESFFARPVADEPQPWRWVCHGAAGEALELEVVPTGFPTQADAESWLGESWRDLLDHGVEQVSLFEADREVYSGMSLRP